MLDYLPAPWPAVDDEEELRRLAGGYRAAPMPVAAAPRPMIAPENLAVRPTFAPAPMPRPAEPPAEIGMGPVPGTPGTYAPAPNPFPAAPMPAPPPTPREGYIREHGERPVQSQYQPAPLSAGRKIGAILTGAAGVAGGVLGVPGAANVGLNAAHDIWTAPSRKAAENYAKATSEYDIGLAAAIGEGQEERQRELDARAGREADVRIEGEKLRNQVTQRELDRLGFAKPEDVVKQYSDALAAGDTQRAEELKPRVQEFLDTTKPGAKAKHAPGEVRLDEGIPTGVYGDDDKLWRANDPGMPADLKASLDDARAAHKQKYGEDLEKQKQGRAIFGERSATDVMTADGNVQAVSGTDLGNFLRSHPGAVVLSPGAVPRAMSQTAQFAEMHTAAKNARAAIQNLDRPFTAEQIGKLTLAMRSEDAGVLRNVVETMVGTQELTSAQQDFVVWINQLNERAMSLRNVAGMGQGSEDMRKAIRATLPGVRSGSKNLALKQLDAFENQINLLEKGVPVVPQRAGAGGVTVQVPGGKSYEFPDQAAADAFKKKAGIP